MKPGDDLIEAVRRFCQARGMSVARLSTLIVNDGKTLPRFTAGEASITLTTYNRIMGWLWDSWPVDAGVEWPAERDKWSAGALGAAPDARLKVPAPVAA